MEPFGSLAEELRTGRIVAATVNVNRKKNTRAFGEIDFVPHCYPVHRQGKAAAPARQTLAEQKNAIMRIAEWARKRGRLKEVTRDGD